MDNKKKAEEAANAWCKESQKRYGYINPASAYLEGISEFQSALIGELEKEKEEYIYQRDGWQENSKNWEAYDLVVRTCEKHIELVKTTTPKTK